MTSEGTMGINLMETEMLPPPSPPLVYTTPTSFTPYSQEIENELKRFAEASDQSIIPEKLLGVLGELGHHGLSPYSWQLLKCLIIARFKQVIAERLSVSPMSGFEAQRDHLIRLINDFSGLPFTLQRICELLTEPGRRQYKSTSSFLFSFEKVVSVTSTTDPLTPEDFNRTIADLTNKMNSLISRPEIFVKFTNRGRLPVVSGDLEDRMPTSTVFSGDGDTLGDPGDSGRDLMETSNSVSDPMLIDDTDS